MPDPDFTLCPHAAQGPHGCPAVKVQALYNTKYELIGWYTCTLCDSARTIERVTQQTSSSKV
jgi:hypothetical protein